MRIITWNVNSVRTRLARLLALLERHEPDVLCLQELKVEEDEFPMLEIRSAGYHAAVSGQRTYNGVAILSREAPRDVIVGLGDGVSDAAARLIGARVGSIRALSVYVPNGGTVGSAKWEYKLAWLERLRGFLDSRAEADEPLAVAGDFNIAPDDDDVHNPERWKDTVLCHPDGRRAFERVMGFGLVDAFRRVHPQGGIYSWWDYRRLAFARKDGLRIDGILLTSPLAERIEGAFVDRDERKGQQPSDHAPLVVDLSG